jgi:hypothetical protein
VIHGRRFAVREPAKSDFERAESERERADIDLSIRMDRKSWAGDEVPKLDQLPIRLALLYEHFRLTIVHRPDPID